MLDQPLDHRGRHRCHVGPDPRAFEHVSGVADRGDEDLGIEQVIVVDQADIADKFHPVEPVVVVPADEGRNERRARLGRQQRLVGGKAQRDVDHRAVARQRLAGLQPVDRQRHLDADVVRDLAQRLGLFHHRLVVERDDLGAHRPVHEGADFLRHFHEVAPGLGDQRGIGGDPVEQAGRGQFLDLGSVGSVGEEFHGSAPIGDSRPALTKAGRRS